MSFFYLLNITISIIKLNLYQNRFLSIGICINLYNILFHIISYYFKSMLFAYFKAFEKFLLKVLFYLLTLKTLMSPYIL